MPGPEIVFTGSIPALYERHFAPVLFEPYAIEIAGRLPVTASRVLEVAAGTGRVTRHLLTALPSTGTLVATDLNEPMLAEAAKAVTDPRVTWRPADAQQLPFPDASFDAVVCQFGLMFVPDKPRAMREFRRVIGPGGRLLLNTWNRLELNPASQMLHRLAVAEFPGDPPKFMLTPFSMPDPAVLRALAAGAGFTDVQVQAVDRIGLSESAAHFATGLVRGNPLANQLAERGIDALALERKVAEALATQFGERPCRSPLSALVLTATA